MFFRTFYFYPKLPKTLLVHLKAQLLFLTIVPLDFLVFNELELDYLDD
ncbi:hypothetical protein VCR4J2_580027 [Vibrio coralliirubri]|nr:hypothetical protein VCR4J2_580027 [Vibrio coralliirubri]